MENMESQLNIFRPAITFTNTIGRGSLTNLRFGFLLILVGCAFTIYLSTHNGDGQYTSALLGSNLVFLALWIEQILLYSYENSFYFRGFDSVIGSGDKNNTGITYEVAETLLINENDATLSFIQSKYGQEILVRAGIDLSKISEFISSERTVIKASTIPLHETQITSIVDVATHLYMYDVDFNNFINHAGISAETFFGSVRFVMRNHYNNKRTQRFWSRDELSKHMGLGRGLSNGTAFELEKFSHNLYNHDILIDYNNTSENHVQLVTKIEHVLARNRSANILLIGNEGAKGIDVINAVQKRIKTGTGLNALAGLNFLVLDTEYLQLSFSNAIDLEREILCIFDQAERAGNMVIVIENISSFIKDTTARGINLPELIDVYLSLPTLHVIGIDNPNNYHQILKKQQSFVRRFEEILIDSSGVADTITLLEGVALRQEKRLGVMYTFESLVAVAISAERYLNSGSVPEQAIDVLHEIGHEAAKQNTNVISSDFVYSFISKKTGIPVGPITITERKKLLQLEDVLHTTIIGQNKAISAIAHTLRRARVDVNRADKPIGSFLFLGPTGVGKTETAKALANTYFGSEDKIIRLDMSEFSAEHTLRYLIGDENGTGILTDKLLDHPYSLVLLDEFEKSASSVKDLFLQILDEGYFTSTHGTKVNARNTIIIATSNAGSDLIKRTASTRAKLPTLDSDIVNHIIDSGAFKTELINRFDNTIIFESLSSTQQADVASLLIKELTKRVQMQGYHLHITSDLMSLLIHRGYSEQFGAREMQRVLQNMIEEKIAYKIISSNLEKGDDIILAPQDFTKEELAY